MVEDLNLGDPEQTQPAVRVRLVHPDWRFNTLTAWSGCLLYVSVSSVGNILKLCICNSRIIKLPLTMLMPSFSSA